MADFTAPAELFSQSDYERKFAEPKWKRKKKQQNKHTSKSKEETHFHLISLKKRINDTHSLADSQTTHFPVLLGVRFPLFFSSLRLRNGADHGSLQDSGLWDSVGASEESAFRWSCSVSLPLHPFVLFFSSFRLAWAWLAGEKLWEILTQKGRGAVVWERSRRGEDRAEEVRNFEWGNLK